LFIRQFPDIDKDGNAAGGGYGVGVLLAQQAGAAGDDSDTGAEVE
jgi:hypothetical protein